MRLIRARKRSVAEVAEETGESPASVYRWLAKLKARYSLLDEPVEDLHLVPGRPKAVDPGLAQRICTRLRAKEDELRQSWKAGRADKRGHPKVRGPRLTMETVRPLVLEEGFKGSESTLRRLVRQLGIATEDLRRGPPGRACG